MITNKSVSYTHLDVYKRQTQYWFDSVFKFGNTFKLIWFSKVEITSFSDFKMSETRHILINK